MKIGVVSDSHGELENLKKAVDWLIKNENINLIIHLGDDSDDVKAIENFGVEILKVPGVFENYYQNPEIPNRILKNFKNWKILITHTETSHKNDLPTDLKPEKLIAEKNVDVVFHGHTHIPRVEEKEGVLFVNPGHLKKEDKKGFPPSFALVEVEDKELKIKIVGLDGREILSKIFKKR